MDINQSSSETVARPSNKANHHVVIYDGRIDHLLEAIPSADNRNMILELADLLIRENPPGDFIAPLAAKLKRRLTTESSHQTAITVMKQIVGFANAARKNLGYGELAEIEQSTSRG